MAPVLALLTSLTYGVGNYLGPRLARDAPYMLLLVVGQGCSFVLSGLAVALSGAAAPGTADLAWALLAGTGNALGLILFYRAAELGPLSVIMPVGSIGVGIPVVAGLASGESLNAVQAAGMVLAISGTVLVARRPPAAPAADAPPIDHTDRDRAIVLSLFAAAAFGVFLAAIKPASEEGAAWAVFVSRFGVVAILVAVALQRRTFSTRLPAPQLGMLAIPGLLLFAGTLSYAAATREGDLTVVSVLGSLFTVVTISLAVTLDHERLPRTGWVGVAAAVVGVVLLSAQ